MKFVLSLLIVFSFTFFTTAQNDEDVTGKKAPNFKLANIKGKYVELAKELGDGPVLLSFWATWCKPCLEEMREYNKIYKQDKENGFKLIAISTDTEKSVAKVKPYVKSKGYDFEVLLDTNSDAARKYYAQQVPYSVLLDKNGNIVYTHLGYMKGDEKKVASLIEKLLEE